VSYRGGKVNVAVHSSKARQKATNESIDKITGLLERFEQRLTLDNLRLSERYVKGELDILVRFKVPRDTENQVALIRANLSVGRSEPSNPGGQFALNPNCHIRGHFLQVPPSNVEAKFIDRENGSHQEPMLVDIVKVMEDPEGVVSSLIWFGSLNQIFSLARGALFLSAVRGQILLETILALENWESRPIRACRSGPGMSTDQLKEKMVKRTSKVMGGISRDECNSARNWLALIQEIGRGVVFDVILGRDQIWLRGKKVGPLPIQVTDVLFGPFDFFSDQM
jgi:hypothetical protein